MKKIFFAFCLALLCTSLCLPSLAFGNYGAYTYDEGKISFASYTDGASAAFDGRLSTSYSGSITGKFAKRTVLSGVTVEVTEEVLELNIYGSEDGSEWILLYNAPKIRSISVFGSDGSGEYTDKILNSMYTYAFTYLRFEIKSGSIAEISMLGYEADVSGTVAEPDKTYGLGGFNCSTIYPPEDVTDQQTFNAEKGANILEHMIGSKDKGGAVVKDDSAPTAFFTVKLDNATRISALSFIHLSNDKNVNRWNGTIFEASADGENWQTIGLLPPDFSYMNDLRTRRTMVFLPVDSQAEYSYVRMSVAKGGMSIGALDIYAATDMPTLDEEAILNSWESDPYIPTTDTSIPETQPSTEPQDTNQKGCRSSALGAALSASVAASALCTCIVCKKRKK